MNSKYVFYVEEVEVRLEIQNPSVLESDGSVTVFVRINQPFSQNINFIISPSDVSAIGEDLYTPWTIAAYVHLHLLLYDKLHGLGHLFVKYYFLCLL